MHYLTPSPRGLASGPRGFFVSAWLLLALTLGCGGTKTPSYGGEEGKSIAQLVDKLIDDRNSQQRLASHFAKGSAPDAAKFKKFAPYAFEVVGDPVIEGANAKATVLVVKDSDRSEVGKKEWTFVKEGSGWKVKDAPLP